MMTYKEEIVRKLRDMQLLLEELEEMVEVLEEPDDRTGTNTLGGVDEGY